MITFTVIVVLAFLYSVVGLPTQIGSASGSR